MHPILFRIPGVDWPLRSFGLMVVLGFLLGSHLLIRLAARDRWIPADKRASEGYQNMPLWIMGGILVGARALYVVVEILRGKETGQGYLDDPLSMFFIWEGGLVMYGGTFGGLLAGWWCVKRYGLPLWTSTDVGLTAGFFGLCIGRIGCLLVGDDYGRPVDAAHLDLPFPAVIKVPESLPLGSLFGKANEGEVLYCTQIWMSLNALLLGFIGLWLLRHRRFPGQVSLLLLLLYSIGRYTIEIFRGDEIRGTWAGFSTSQWISMALGATCLVLLLFNLRRRDDPPPDDAEEMSAKVKVAA